MPRRKPRVQIPLSICRSRVDYELSSECEGGTRLCEGRRPEFDSWRGHFFAVCFSSVSKTLEPDGQAAGCRPAEVGSTPTGVSS